MRVYGEELLDKTMTQQEVFTVINHYKFIPLFNNDDAEISKLALQAAYDGGVRVFEFTNRSANALEVFKALVDYRNKNLKDLVLGAGTILNTKDAQAFRDVGSDFIVAPNISVEVGIWCTENNVFWCPGAATLNEILLAQSLGADLVKIFPANFLGGPSYLKALRGPCPDIQVLITGGVEPNEENLKAWFDAGATAVGMGSNLFDKKAMEQKDFSSIQNLCNKITNIISKY